MTSLCRLSFIPYIFFHNHDPAQNSRNLISRSNWCLVVIYHIQLEFRKHHFSMFSRPRYEGRFMVFLSKKFHFIRTRFSFEAITTIKKVFFLLNRVRFQTTFKAERVSCSTRSEHVTCALILSIRNFLT